MSFTFTNFAESKLQTGISVSATQATISTDDDQLFATFTGTGGEVQRAVIYDGTNTPELVDISLRADETIDITRALESTTALAWPAGSVIRGVLTAGMMAAAAREITGATDQIEITGGDGLTGTTIVGLASEINLASKTVANINVISGQGTVTDWDVNGDLTASELQVTSTALFSGRTEFASDAQFEGMLTASDGKFHFGGSASQGHELELFEDSTNGVNFISLKAPDSLATSMRIEYPTVAGTVNQILEIASLSTDVIPLLTLQWTANTALGTDWDDMEEFSAYQLGLGGL